MHAPTDARDPTRALRALAAIAGVATLGLLGLLLFGAPDLIVRLPAWAMPLCAGTMLAAVVGLELAKRGGRAGALAVLAKIGFAVLVAVALILLLQVATLH